MKKCKFKSICNRWIDKLFWKVPDRVTGRKISFEKEFFRLYGLKNVENQITAIKKENFKRYLSILGCFILLMGLTFFSSLTDPSNAILIDSEGRAYFERPTVEEGVVKVPLNLFGKVGDQEIKKTVTLTMKPEGSNKEFQKEAEDIKEDPETKATNSINDFMRNSNKSDSGKFVYLPNKLSGIDCIAWETKASNPMKIIISLGIIAFIITFLGRYNSATKLKMKCDESIARELPEFLNKIVLLMNAGLVLTAAFEKIMQDYGSRKFDNQSYFYNQLEEIYIKISQVNSPMIFELKLFAERSRNREFMRLTNIMADNLNKGSELVNKLEAESSFLWFERKKQAEEKGRLAETKLTMPLAIQLLVLIIITVAPALMNM